MRKLWLELVGLDSFICLTGPESVVDTTKLDNNQQQYLNSINGIIRATDLAGFGYEANTSASYVEPFGFVETKNEIAQPAISGNLNFIRPAPFSAGAPYGYYKNFVKLVQGRKLRLIYAPQEETLDKAFRLDGSLTKLMKGEIKASRLQCPFEFRGTSPFYLEALKTWATIAANTALDINPRAGMLSDYRNAFTATIEINDTPSSNFSARIYHNTNGYSVAVLDLQKTLNQGDVVVWSSDPENPRVTVNGVDQIIAGKVNLSNDVFPSITGSDLRFATDIAVKVKFEYKAYYWGA